MARSGPGVTAEGIGVSRGDLADAVEEVADHHELVVGVVREDVAGDADEVAEDFLVPGGGGLGGLYQQPTWRHPRICRLCRRGLEERSGAGVITVPC